MSEAFPADSVGLVSPQHFTFDTPLELSCGRSLKSYELVVETYGELNADKSNGVLIFHALSGHHHAAGYHSAGGTERCWLEAYIRPGKPLLTRQFFRG